MTKDARFLLNKKKWTQSRRQNVGNKGIRIKVAGKTVDARNVLNLKRATKVSPRKGNFLKSSQASTSSGISIVKKSFPAYPKVPRKHIELAHDGNIWITAKAKEPQAVTNSMRIMPNAVSTRPKPVPLQWTPADFNMDNLEHIAIDDVIDMESLPAAMVSSNVHPRNRLATNRSLAQEVLSMQNTMVADQVASTAANQSACVVVTNLRPSVSRQDLMELFGDIGLVKSAEIKHPGSAVIEFYNIEDAAQACSIYHSRLLDGQPMECYLHTNPSQQRTSVSQRLGERVHNVTPKPFTLSSMSSNPRSRYNPRDVRFTVKLT